MFTLPAKPAVLDTVQPLPRFSTTRAQVLAVVLLTMLPAFVLIFFNTVDEREPTVDFSRQEGHCRRWIRNNAGSDAPIINATATGSRQE